MHWRPEVTRLITDGPVPLKAGVAGVGVLLSALWDHAGSLAVALLIFLWVLDMGSGILRAIDRDGIDGFDWPRFWQGFRKLLAAMTAVGLAIAGELLLVEGGMQWAPVTVAVTAVVGLGFFFSALQNLTHFFPNLQDAVRVVLKRGVQPASGAGDKPPDD